MNQFPPRRATPLHVTPEPPSATTGRTDAGVAWLGWTALLTVATVAVFPVRPDAPFWWLLVMPLVIGALSGSKAFLVSPFVLGVGALIWIAAAEERNPGAIYDGNTGAQGAFLAVAILTVGAVVAASVGVTIGIVARQRFRKAKSRATRSRSPRATSGV